MVAAARYPKAIWKGDGQSGGTYEGRPWRVVLHTTETPGLPGYSNGASAPHLTYLPKTRQWIQHTELTTAARALRNEAGGVQTNRARAIQVEIVCYSAKAIAHQAPATRLWVGDLPATAYADIREFIRWTRVVPLVWPGKQALSSSQANAPGFRMTMTEWNAFNGVCAHQHVPENTHWDTGAFDWGRLLQPEEEDDMIPQLTTGLRERDIIRHHELGIVGPQKGQSKQDSIATWVARLANPNDPAWNRYWAVLLTYPAVAAAQGVAPTGVAGPYTISLTGSAVPS